MPSDNEIRIILNFVNNASAEMQKLQSQFTKVGDSAEKGFSRVAKALNTDVSRAVHGVIGGITAVGVSLGVIVIDVAVIFATVDIVADI